MSQLKRDDLHHDAVVVIAGDGPLRGALVERARQLGLGEDQVRFRRTKAVSVKAWRAAATAYDFSSYD